MRTFRFAGITPALAAALLAAVSLATTAHAQVASRPGLTLEGAKTVAAAAAAEARRLGAGGAIAVTDEGGALLYLERLDQTFVASTTVAIEKARTAAQFRRPTRDFENAIAKGRTALVAVGAMTPLQGGVPILMDGQVVGAIGVSGAMSAQQDDDIATVAAGALAGPAPAATMSAAAAADGVVMLAGDATRAAFARGTPLFETAGYKIHASRREAPGMAEIHSRDTDIVYVLEGTATLVTGGRARETKTVAPDEIRGAAIDGGTTRALAKGDVIVIPNGVAHWFRDVKGPFLYYVVKVTAPAPSTMAGGTR
jgi:uncharacterized protein GlcG (DUF336 family)/quercetin dioxygenase-like cupin family protein